MKVRVIAVDIVFMVSLCAFLVAAVLLGVDKYLWRFPYITLLGFYLIGKFARDYELRLWDRKRKGQATPG